MTAIEDILKEDETGVDIEAALAMKRMPERANKAMLTERRKRITQPIHDHTSIDQVDVMKEIRETEEVFAERWDHTPLPEVLLRLEAQDLFMEFLHERLVEEDIVDEQ